MNKEKIMKVLTAFCKQLPLIICVVFALIYLMTGENITAEKILNYAPANLWLAALFLLSVYVVKSLCVFFPVIALYIAGGFLFPPFPAMIINIIGGSIGLIIPYWAGRLSGAEKMNKLFKRYPSVNEIMIDDKNKFKIIFFARMMAFLPGDIVSMYFGTTKISFKKYFSASLLGTIPGAVASTLIGVNLKNPMSSGLWIWIIVAVIIFLVSLIIYFLRKKGKENNI